MNLELTIEVSERTYNWLNKIAAREKVSLAEVAARQLVTMGMLDEIVSGVGDARVRVDPPYVRRIMDEPHHLPHWTIDPSACGAHNVRPLYCSKQPPAYTPEERPYQNLNMAYDAYGQGYSHWSTPGLPDEAKWSSFQPSGDMRGLMGEPVELLPKADEMPTRSSAPTYDAGPPNRILAPVGMITNLVYDRGGVRCPSATFPTFPYDDRGSDPETR